MKNKYCPRKKFCRVACDECDFHIAFNKMSEKVNECKGENAKLKRKLAKYEELGTVEELNEALYSATL